MVISLLSVRYSNSYLFVDKNKDSVLIDVNDDYLKLEQELNRGGYKLKAILLTHGHFDHIYSLNEILAHHDVPIYLFKSEQRFLEEPNLNLSRYNSHNPNHDLVIHAKNVRDAEEGMPINILNVPITVIHTPFHTSGSVCYYIKDENILFSGDTLFYSTIGRCDLPTSSENTIESSLGKLALLPEDTVVYPGHGKATSIGRELKHNAYFQFLSKK